MHLCTFLPAAKSGGFENDKIHEKNDFLYTYTNLYFQSYKYAFIQTIQTILDTRTLPSHKNMQSQIQERTTGGVCPRVLAIILIRRPAQPMKRQLEAVKPIIFKIRACDMLLFIRFGVAEFISDIQIKPLETVLAHTQAARQLSRLIFFDLYGGLRQFKFNLGVTTF